MTREALYGTMQGTLFCKAAGVHGKDKPAQLLQKELYNST